MDCRKCRFWLWNSVIAHLATIALLEVLLGKSEWRMGAHCVLVTDSTAGTTVAKSFHAIDVINGRNLRNHLEFWTSSNKHAQVPAALFAGETSCGAAITVSSSIAGDGPTRSIIDCHGSGLRALSVLSSVSLTVSGISLLGGTAAIRPLMVPKTNSLPNFQQIESSANHVLQMVSSAQTAILNSVQLQQIEGENRARWAAKPGRKNGTHWAEDRGFISLFSRQRQLASSSVHRADSSNVKPWTTLEEPATDGLGGCILLQSGASLLIENCSLRNCSATYGGAIGAMMSGSGKQSIVSVSNCEFTTNRAVQGGALWLASNKSEIHNCLFRKNAAFSHRSDVVKVHSSTNSLPVDTSGVAFGGAMFLTQGNVLITGTQCLGNAVGAQANGSYGGKMIAVAGGGCIASVEAQSFSLETSTVANNFGSVSGDQSGVYGGALLVIATKTASVFRAEFRNNFLVADCQSGGAVASNGCFGHGGALAFYFAANVRIQHNTSLEGNLITTTCADGGKGSCASFGAGLFSRDFVGLQVVNSSFLSNMATIQCKVGGDMGCFTGGGAVFLEQGNDFDMEFVKITSNRIVAFCQGGGSGGCWASGASLNVQGVIGSSVSYALLDLNAATISCGNAGHYGCFAQSAGIYVTYSQDIRVFNMSAFHNKVEATCIDSGLQRCAAQGGIVFAFASSAFHIFGGFRMEHNSGLVACESAQSKHGCTLNGLGINIFQSRSVKILDLTFANNYGNVSCLDGTCGVQGMGVTSFLSEESQIILDRIVAESNFCGVEVIRGSAAIVGCVLNFELSSATMAQVNLSNNHASVHCQSKNCSAQLYGAAIASVNSYFINMTNFDVTRNIGTCTMPTHSQSRPSDTSNQSQSKIFPNSGQNSAFAGPLAQAGACIVEGGVYWAFRSPSQAQKFRAYGNGLRSQNSGVGSFLAGGSFSIQLSELRCESCNFTKNFAFADDSGSPEDDAFIPTATNIVGTVLSGGGLHCIGAVTNVVEYNNVSLPAIPAHVFLVDSLFQGNSLNSSSQSGASFGGAMRVNSFCNATIMASVLDGNIALSLEHSSSSGQAVSAAGHIIIHNSVIINHSTPSGMQGSTLHATGEDAMVQMNGVQALNNSGPAIYTVGNVVVSIWNSTIRSTSFPVPFTDDLSNEAFTSNFIGVSQRDVDVETGSFECSQGYIPITEFSKSLISSVAYTLQCATSTCFESTPFVTATIGQASSLLVQCRRCKSGTYSLNSAANYKTSCLQCPFGAICKGGAAVFSKRGYWGQVSGAMELPSKLNLVVPGYSCSDSICSSYDSCAPGRQGVLCGKCAPGFGALLLSGACTPDTQCYARTWIIPIAFLLMNFGAVALLTWASTNRSKSPGLLTIAVAYFQMSSLVITSTAWASISKGVSTFLLSIFAASQGGAATTTLTHSYGLCLAPGMTSWMMILFQAASSLVFLTIVILWSVVWPVIFHQFSHRWKSSLVSSTSVKMSIRTRDGSTMMSSLIGSKSKADVSASRGVAYYQAFEIVYQSFLIVSVRSITNVHVPGLGFRWLYDGDHTAAVWQIGPGLLLALLLMLPAFFVAWLESFRKQEERLQNSAPSNSWRQVMERHHTLPFRREWRHWRVAILYRRAFMVMLHLIVQPIVLSLCMTMFLLVSLLVEWIVSPFVSKRIQNLELLSLFLVTTQSVLQIRGSALQSAAAISTSTSIDEALAWLTALMVLLPAIFAVAVVVIGIASKSNLAMSVRKFTPGS